MINNGQVRSDHIRLLIFLVGCILLAFGIISVIGNFFPDVSIIFGWILAIAGLLISSFSVLFPNGDFLTRFNAFSRTAKFLYIGAILGCILVVIAFSVLKMTGVFSGELYTEASPPCTNLSEWSVPNHINTKVDCTTETITQISQAHYASVLVINNGSIRYNETSLNAHVEVTFKNSSDKNTYGGLIIESQDEANGFLCAVNSDGKWELAQVNAGNIYQVQAASIPIGLSYQANIGIKAEGSYLYCYVNGNQVGSPQRDTFAGEVGIVVLDQIQPSVPVSFSNFELDN